ncbi:hypothetical protein BDR06DRAFT_963062 [Suillus hirtellus]|nr:hypothetical protein BDR06DRAFT_963062 [Suillus hirtellus]
MHFSLLAVVVALTASTSVSACAGFSHVCTRHTDCCEGLAAHLRLDVTSPGHHLSWQLERHITTVSHASAFAVVS